MVFTDGSRSEREMTASGWWKPESRGGGGKAIGKITTVWDGETNGILNGISRHGGETKLLVLSDSQAAIMAVKKAGKVGKARTSDLRKVIEEVAKRQEALGPDAVSLGWVKAHRDPWKREGG